MCAEQRAGKRAAAAVPARAAADTLSFAGHPLSDKLLKQLGQGRAAWVDPTNGTVVQVAAFQRPLHDPRPAIPSYAGGDGSDIVRPFDEVCPLHPVDLDR